MFPEEIATAQEEIATAQKVFQKLLFDYQIRNWNNGDGIETIVLPKELEKLFERTEDVSFFVVMRDDKSYFFSDGGCTRIRWL